MGERARRAGLDPETLVYGLSLASDPQFRPGRAELVYALRTVDRRTRRPRSRLWTCAVDGTSARALTGAEQDASTPCWSPDGHRLACLLADPDGTSLVVLGPGGEAGASEVARHAEDIDELAWSPDGRRLAYTARFDPENPDEEPERPGAAPKVRVTRRLDYKFDGLGFLGDRRKQVFVVDVAGGRRRRLTGELVDHEGPEWSPDGRSILVCVHRPDRAGMQLVMLDAATGAAEPVGPATGMVTSWSWSPTGEHIVFVADPDRTLQPDYFVWRLADRSLRRLTDDLQSMPAASPAAWVDPRRALVHAIRAGGSCLEVVDIETGDVRVVAAYQARNEGLSLDSTGRFVAQAQATLTSVGEISVHDLELGCATTITAHNQAVLTATPPARWEALQVIRGGQAIDAWLLKPPDFDPARRYPLVLDVHGGPSDSYGYGFLAHEQCLATNGYLVLYANPRGSTSYGRAFAAQVLRDWGGGDYDDVIAVLDAVLERPYVDRERTGIFGISYGGYLTAWAIGHSDRFAAAVCGEPIFDLASDYGTSDVAFVGLEHHGGGPPHAEPDWYRDHSPSTFAHRIRTPTLIFHGEADQRCPIGQSEQMFVALRKAGCEVEFVRYPGGSHMFFAAGLPEHRVDFLTRVLAWFDQHLGREPSQVAAG